MNCTHQTQTRREIVSCNADQPNAEELGSFFWLFNHARLLMFQHVGRIYPSFEQAAPLRHGSHPKKRSFARVANIGNDHSWRSLTPFSDKHHMVNVNYSDMHRTRCMLINTHRTRCMSPIGVKRQFRHCLTFQRHSLETVMTSGFS